MLVASWRFYSSSKRSELLIASQFTFVLVHGAWHGGWCYARVLDRLRRAGCRVFTPTLTGLADRSHLFSRRIALGTHVSDVVNLIRWERLQQVVLVGHSYGGMVITGAADQIPGNIASLVYVDAFLPKDGQCLHDLLPKESVRTHLASAVRGGIPPVPASLLNVNEADRGWVDALCTPQPLGTFVQPFRRTRALSPTVPQTYVLATANVAGAGFDRICEPLRTNPLWTTYEVRSGHDVMIDCPAELTNILLACAGTAESSKSGVKYQ